MKVAIQQETLVRALEHGAMAALSEEAQSDTSIVSLLIKSVSIKFDSKNMTVKSATKLLASRYIIPIKDGSGIEVKEEGEILVPADELYKWAKRQQEAKIGLSLSKLDNPEIINPLASETDGASVKGIKRIGTVKMVSKDETKTGNKWSLDCYADGQLGDYSIDVPKEYNFMLPVKQMNEGLKSVAFAAMPKHHKHVYDSISFQSFKDDGKNRLFMLASDMARAAIYEANEVKDNKLVTPMFVPMKFFAEMSKLANPEVEMAFYMDTATNKIYMYQGEEFVVKMSTADPSSVSSYPPISMLANKKYIPLGKAPKGVIINRLITSSLVNNMANLFYFKDNKLAIHAISSSGKSPSTGMVNVNDFTIDYSAIWGANHLLDYLRIAQDEEVVFLIPEDRSEVQSLKLKSEKDPNWSYFIMAQDSKKTKYDQVKID